jgi:hypothetical protein
MAIVIGAATTVSIQGACAISANWGASPNTQRLYCIGEWKPNALRVFERPTATLSITVYASSGIEYNTEPSTDCTSAAGDFNASVSPKGCGGSTLVGVSGPWFVNSYSYSKDDGAMPGQETWSLTKWFAGTTPNSPMPSYVLRGISEGSSTGTETGIEFDGATSSSSTGSVSAGGFGRADTLTVGVVKKVGSGSSAAGVTGQGSASMPYTPLYI